MRGSAGSGQGGPRRFPQRAPGSPTSPGLIRHPRYTARRNWTRYSARPPRPVAGSSTASGAPRPTTVLAIWGSANNSTSRLPTPKSGPVLPGREPSLRSPWMAGQSAPPATRQVRILPTHEITAAALAFARYRRQARRFHRMISNALAHLVEVGGGNCRSASILAPSGRWRLTPRIQRTVSGRSGCSIRVMGWAKNVVADCHPNAGRQRVEADAP